jgi:surface antigen
VEFYPIFNTGGEKVSFGNFSEDFTVLLYDKPLSRSAMSNSAKRPQHLDGTEYATIFGYMRIKGYDGYGTAMGNIYAAGWETFNDGEQYTHTINADNHFRDMSGPNVTNNNGTTWSLNVQEDSVDDILNNIAGWEVVFRHMVFYRSINEARQSGYVRFSDNQMIYGVSGANDYYGLPLLVVDPLYFPKSDKDNDTDSDSQDDANSENVAWAKGQIGKSFKSTTTGENECVAWADEYTKHIGKTKIPTHYGPFAQYAAANMWENGPSVGWTQTQTPTLGALVIFAPTESNSYGHVAVVSGTNPLEFLDQNGGNRYEPVTERGSTSGLGSILGYLY